MSKYQLKQIDIHTMNIMETEWTAQIDAYADSIYTTTYQRQIVWAKDLVSKRGTPNNFAYALIDDSSKSNKVVAVLDITHAAPRSSVSWMKLLDITFQPSLDVALHPSPLTLATIVAEAIQGALSLTDNQHICKKLKIRTDEFDHQLIKDTAASHGHALGYKITAYPGWVEIEKN